MGSNHAYTLATALVLLTLIARTLAKINKIYHHGNIAREIDTLSWAVEIKSGTNSKDVLDDLAYAVALDTGLTNHGQIGKLKGHYLFYHTDHDAFMKTFQMEYYNHSESLLRYIEKDADILNEVREKTELILNKHPYVESALQQVIRARHKRSINFNDPAYPRQWHLHNHQDAGMDINITGVWEHNITGYNITVAVVDDGLQWDIKDLKDNYNARGSYDLNGNDPDPMPSPSKGQNHHGTRCAGEIAAVANNDFCAVGVAYGSKISGLRVLDGPMTDSLEADAFNMNMEVNDVYSCSWGPDDDGKTVDGPHYLAQAAMKHGVVYGRGGYGSVYVVASGNGGNIGDNCNYDGYASSLYTVTIGAVDEQGVMPYYAEECASMLAVTFSSGSGYRRSIVTSDWTMKGGSGCTDSHSGTSAAAPLAAGMVALMLDTNPCLTWRDIQYIIVLTSVKVDVDLAHWQTNAAGLHHSHKHGFGLMNAWRLVNTAKVWRSLPWMSSYASSKMQHDEEIPKEPNSLKLKYEVTEEMLSGFELNTLEYVQVSVSLDHQHRGHVKILLLDPHGAISVLGAPRPHDSSGAGLRDWLFSTVRCWGQVPYGEWTLVISDTGPKHIPAGKMLSWQLRLYGSSLTAEDVAERKRLVEDACSGGILGSNRSAVCSPPPVVAPVYEPMAERTIKVLVLASAFCLFMALYETWEYAFCYNDEKKEHERKWKIFVRAHRESTRIQAGNDSRGNYEAIEMSERTHLIDDTPREDEEETIFIQPQRHTQNDDITTVNDDILDNGDISNLSIIENNDTYDDDANDNTPLLPRGKNPLQNGDIALAHKQSESENGATGVCKVPNNINAHKNTTDGGGDTNKLTSSQALVFQPQLEGESAVGDASLFSNFEIPREILETLTEDEIKLNMNMGK
ncbi:unnamed protein product [Owenia fusiformis]|uniref:Uncharacterized protein n=1 Tax=Owenia fusiformis TaxID=6347 RepID=A0A8J1XU47_OWEFU|nr:unnamed protein product [Owenia fusiformis]